MLFFITFCLTVFSQLVCLADSEADQPEVAEKSQPASEPEKQPAKRLFGKSETISYRDKVVVIKVGKEDLIYEQRYKFIRRSLRKAEEDGAAAVVFDINTPGGLAWETTEFMMQDLAKTKLKTIAYVNPSAVSAGAMICMGCDVIYMAPASAIGAAAVVSSRGEMGDTERAKAESYLIAAVEGVAEAKGHNPELARAMMKVEYIYEEGSIFVDSDELLTLNAQQAVREVDGKPLLAAGIIDSLDEVIATEGLADKEVVDAAPEGMVKIALWISGISGLLIMIGLGAAYLEMKTPGFGIGGAISLFAFGLFFFGNNLAGNLAGYGALTVFVIGIILIIFELFIAPGLIIPGLVGGCMVLGSIFYAMIDDVSLEDFKGRDKDAAMDFSPFESAIFQLSIGVIGSLVILALLMRFLPQMPLFNRMVMDGKLGKGDGTDDRVERSKRIGMVGVASTDLRPAGKAVFDGETLDVTAKEVFVAEGTSVTITAESGMGLEVEISKD